MSPFFFWRVVSPDGEGWWLLIAWRSPSVTSRARAKSTGWEAREFAPSCVATRTSSSVDIVAGKGSKGLTRSQRRIGLDGSGRRRGR